MHIQAIRHLVPDTHSIHDPKLQVAVHHHCKAYDDGTFVCLMFHSGMKDQDNQKPEDKYPLGEPYVVIVQDMPEQD